LTDVGRRLRELRRARALSQTELGRRVGVTASALSQIERGKTRPAMTTLASLAAELGSSIDDLMRDESKSFWAGAERAVIVRRQPVDEAAFRTAIAHFATGVTIITTLDAGKPAGMTASAVTSLSLDPVLLLVCINHKLRTHEAIDNSNCFVVNVLGERQEELALHFARPSPDKFAGIELDLDHELPVLSDAIAWFSCDVQERFPGGDHTIFTGLVTDCAAKPGRRPLLYFRSGFGTLRDQHSEALEDAVSWDMPSLLGSSPSHLRAKH
jgi:flavin reductase (DIM6/NTAB) family NADH-FMN oxidoreductase RutF/DNA-binding XRE family transcriptional regulator